jgi:hypothetical protein
MMRKSNTPERKSRKKTKRENSRQNDLTPEFIAQKELTETEISVGPKTPLGKLLTSISAIMNRANAAKHSSVHAPSAAPSAATAYADAMSRALLKRRLAQCPAITEMTATDPVQVIDWIRAQESLLKADLLSRPPNYSTALAGLAGTCDLRPDNPIQVIIKASGLITRFDHTAWLKTCKSILLNTSIPFIVQQMDAALEAIPAHMADEPLSMYYNRYNALLSRTQWLRAMLAKDTSDYWLRPCIDRWARKLNDTQLTAATLRFGHGATLHDFYGAVVHAEQCFRLTNTVKSA